MGQSLDEITEELAERLCWDLSNSVGPCSQVCSQKAWTYQPSLRLRETVASRKHVSNAAHQDGEPGIRTRKRVPQKRRFPGRD
jgi:hypothetical protein